VHTLGGGIAGDCRIFGRLDLIIYLRMDENDLVKKFLYISTIGFAVMTLLFFTVVRHHHHGERICFEIEHCSENADCENGSGGGNHEDHPCISDTDYLLSNEGELRCKTACCNNPNHNGDLMVIDLFSVTDLVFLSENMRPKPKWWVYVDFLPSPFISASNGLRAPPAIG
jgi:hypothetical protein